MLPFSNWITIFSVNSFATPWLLFNISILAALEIIVSTGTNSNSAYTNIKPPERNTVISKKYGSYFKYSIYDVTVVLLSSVLKPSLFYIHIIYFSIHTQWIF